MLAFSVKKIIIEVMIVLTKKEKQNLELRHKKCRDGRECDRIKAVLLSDEGWSTKTIFQALRKHESSIVRHLNDFIEADKLKPVSGGSKNHLSVQETEGLIKHLCDKTYLHQHEIVAYIKATYSVNYSIPGLNKWLHANGFSYKKPKGVPHKFDEEKQAEFIEEYKKLKASLRDNEPLLFIDAVHPTQATKITAGWIKKGSDKAIKTTESRTRLNVIGAIQLGKLSETVSEQYKTVNGDSIVCFLQKIREQYRLKDTIHLVLDGAGYHCSALVIDEAKRLKITLHYLPPYSPSLNPIERLWKVMNKEARNGKYFATAKEFRQQIGDFFKKTLPDIGGSLDSTINNNFQILNSEVPTF